MSPTPNPTKPQDLVNTALYIIYHELGIKQNQLLEDINAGKALAMNQSQLSKAYQLKEENGVLFQKSREGLSREKLRKLSDWLKEYLATKQIHYVNSLEYIFQGHGKFWPPIKGVPFGTGAIPLELANSSDLVKTHENWDPQTKPELFENVKSIDLLTTYFSSLSVLLTQLKDAIEKNNCKVRILMLDPSQDVIRIRAKGLVNKVGENPIEKAKGHALRLADFTKKYPDNVEFYLYNVLPGFAIYRFDDTWFIGYQWFNRLAREGAYHEFRVQVNQLSPFMRNMSEHWSNIWNYARFWKDLNRYSQKLTCYISKENKIEEMALMINPSNHDAVLIASKRYYGTFYNLSPNLSLINLNGENDVIWPITFFLNAELQHFDNLELVTGIYMIHSPHERENLCRRFVLVNNDHPNHKSNPIAEKDRTQLLSEYLSSLDTINAANWQGLKDKMKARK